MDKKQFINEVCHRFNRQYDLTKHIAEKIYDSLFTNNNTSYVLEIDISQFKVFSQKIKVYVSKSGNLKNSYGSFNDFDPLTISITVYSNYDMLNRNWLISDIQKVISHEMMHGNIYYHTYDTFKGCDKSEIIDILNKRPEYYDGCHEILKSGNDSIIEYLFAQALYSTFFNEQQSFVAQSDSEIRKMLLDYHVNNISYKNVPNILSRVHVYQIFLDILYICDLIKNMSPFEQVEFINKFNVLMKYSKIEYKNLEKTLKNIILVSKNVLKNIEEILVTTFYEIK